MHTPEQAKELWCPMARVAVAHKEEGETEYTMGDAVYNRVAIKAKPTTIPRSCNCMADKCAMWRWGEDLPFPKTSTGETGPEGWTFQQADPSEGTEAQWVEPLASRRARCVGFCGLAPAALQN